MTRSLLLAQALGRDEELGEHSRRDQCARIGRARTTGRLAIAALLGTVLAGTMLAGIGFADPAPGLPGAPSPDAAAVPEPALPALPALPGLPAIDPRHAGPALPELPALPANPVDPVNGTPQTSDVQGEADEVGADKPAEPAQEPSGPATVDGGVPIEGTPCSGAVQACVDLTTLRAWLITDGQVRRGPVNVRVGDELGPTPVGRFRVQWKDENHVSSEFGTPMHWAVFFADGGIAFHEGRQDTDSAGCVKLSRDDARAFFYALQIDDAVQIVRTVAR